MVAQLVQTTTPRPGHPHVRLPRAGGWRSRATPTSLGRVGGALAESLAWLNSPGAIAGEIRRLERAIAAGDRSEATRVQLADWRAVRVAQARVVSELTEAS